jgi:hypothetical protein
MRCTLTLLIAFTVCVNADAQQSGSWNEDTTMVAPIEPMPAPTLMYALGNGLESASGNIIPVLVEDQSRYAVAMGVTRETIARTVRDELSAHGLIADFDEETSEREGWYFYVMINVVGRAYSVDVSVMRYSIDYAVDGVRYRTSGESWSKGSTGMLTANAEGLAFLLEQVGEAVGRFAEQYRLVNR